jgi:hypothetical protein
MTIRRSPLLLLLGALTAGSLAMAPVVPFTGEDEGAEEGEVTAGEDGDGGTVDEPELYEACDPVEGVTTITPDAGFDDVVPTPVGAGNFMPAEDAGLYQLDLSGLEVGTNARVRMVLSWDTPALGDYDLVINGTNEGAVDDPETHTRILGHCAFLDLETLVFTGLPVDTLELQVEVATVFAPPPAPIAEPTTEPTAEPSPGPSPEA